MAIIRKDALTLFIIGAIEKRREQRAQRKVQIHRCIPCRNVAVSKEVLCRESRKKVMEDWTTFLDQIPSVGAGLH